MFKTWQNAILIRECSHREGQHREGNEGDESNEGDEGRQCNESNHDNTCNEGNESNEGNEGGQVQVKPLYGSVHNVYYALSSKPINSY